MEGINHSSLETSPKNYGQILGLTDQANRYLAEDKNNDGLSHKKLWFRTPKGGLRE